MWNLTNCKLKKNHYGHSGYLNTVTVSPDGSLCASGGKVFYFLFILTFHILVKYSDFKTQLLSFDRIAKLCCGTWMTINNFILWNTVTSLRRSVSVLTVIGCALLMDRMLKFGSVSELVSTFEEMSLHLKKWSAFITRIFLKTISFVF